MLLPFVAFIWVLSICRASGVNEMPTGTSSLTHIRGSNNARRGVRWDDASSMEIRPREAEPDVLVTEGVLPGVVDALQT
jgi:hypothetical protein